MTARETFSLYLEGSGPGERASRARQDAGEVAFEAARASWSGRLHGPLVTADDVEGALGPPDLRAPGLLGYALAGRPGHLYVFRFDVATRRALGSGYRRVGARREGPPRRAADYAQRLASMEATSEEIQEWLGEPVDRDGWWPTEVWEYDDGLSIELRHGVVEPPPGER